MISLYKFRWTFLEIKFLIDNYKVSLISTRNLLEIIEGVLRVSLDFIQNNEDINEKFSPQPQKRKILCDRPI